MGKLPIPTIKAAKITYSNSSRKLTIARKCSIKLISVKTFKRGFAFFVKKTLKDMKYRSFKLAKVFPQ